MSAKRLGIIGLFATLLVAGAVADTATLNNDTTTTTATNASQKAIKDLCQNTNNQQTCIYSLSKATNSSDPKTLIQISFQLIMKEVENVIKQIDNIQSTSKDPLIAKPDGVYGCCQMWLRSSIEDLQKAVNRVNSVDNTGDLTVVTDDIQTYLSGVATYQESCMDCFEDDPDGTAKMAELLKVAHDLTANGLALANEFPKLLKS